MEKNVALPDELLSAVAEMAQVEGKTTDELIELATRGYIAQRRLERLARRNEVRARELGIREADVPGIVREWRAEQRGR